MTVTTPPLNAFTVADQAVCGTLGCHRDDALRVVHTDHGKRVVCPDHAERLLADPNDARPPRRWSP